MAIQSKIKFGTSGWRGIISDDFTFDNVKIVTQAIADFIKSSKKEKGKPIIIGGDARFLSEKFSEVAAEVMAGNGIEVLLCNRDTPTPVISYEIIRRKAAGAINFTASHNPPEYNGLKFSPSWGGPATPAETDIIEKNIQKVKVVRVMSKEDAVKKGLIKYFEPSTYYLKRLKEIIDFKVIKKLKSKIIVDPLYATGRGYLDRILQEQGAKIKVINDYRDVLFGGHPPEPAEKHIGDLIDTVKKEKAIIGIATDGDADRYGIVDSDGTYIQANQILPLLLDYLVRTRGWKGAVVRSVATSHMIDKVAEIYNLKLYETPVGFKYIGEIMTKEDIVIGGEESNGLTVYRHIPEKDGILACLLVVEMVAREKKCIKELLFNLQKKIGTFFTKRENIKLTEIGKIKLQEKLKSFKEKKFGSFNIEKLVTIDGYKFILENGNWAMIRFSGTEPIVRLYAEAKDEVILEQIVKQGKMFVLGKEE